MSPTVQVASRGVLGLACAAVQASSRAAAWWEREVEGGTASAVGLTASLTTSMGEVVATVAAAEESFLAPPPPNPFTHCGMGSQWRLRLLLHCRAAAAPTILVRVVKLV